MSDQDMETRLAAYLAHRMPEAKAIAVDGLSRIPGGSSQETFKFRAVWDGEEHWLIARRAPEQGLVVAERDLEFTVYTALAGSGVPVPRALFLELDPAWLDRPFFIMTMAPGKPGFFYLSDDPYEGRAREVGARFWRHLGALAALDHLGVGLGGLRNGARVAGFWAAELDWWEGILDEKELMIEPAVRGALRWLRRNPSPEAAKPAVVHGDYRVGNFLFTPDGVISAVLDWEMAHIGDPLEDIAWSLNPMWPMDRYFPREAGLAAWEQASGMRIDRAALDWWLLFGGVKACAIWTTAEAAFTGRSSRDMTVAMTAVRAQSFHRREIMRMMEQRGAMG